METPLITLAHVTKVFFDRPGEELKVLDNINLEVFDGEFFILLGPSGSGKSTLLRIMSGLEKQYEGQITMAEGIDKSAFNFVFQQFALLPWLTVAQNIELGLLARGVDVKERNQIIQKEHKQFRLEHFAKVKPRELSGGMRQRVGIARALATNPRVLFMDEPFSELDSFIAEELRQALLEIWQERKLTIIMVTHIVEEALQLASRIGILTSQPGKIEKIIESQLPRPRNKRSPEFFALEDKIYGIIKP